jgi:signal transduction histidine kinase
MNFDQYFKTRPQWFLGTLCLTSTLIVGTIDYITGPRIMLLAFYLAPLCVCSWFSGWRWGFIIAVVSAAVWSSAQLFDPTAEYRGWLLMWNSFIGLSVFSIAAVLTRKVAERKRVEAALRDEQKLLQQRIRERATELAKANQELKAEVEERTQAQTKLKLLNETLEQRVAERSTAAEMRALELARSETTLRQQTSILQSILNSMGDGVIVADAHARIFLANPAAERLLTKGIGQAYTDWINQQTRGWPETVTVFPPTEYPLLRAVRGEAFDGIEFCLRNTSTPDPIWISCTGRPLIDDKNTPQGGVIVLRDITPGKLMEKQIAEVSDREQSRIGQDLHDGLCQHLVSIGFATELLRETLQHKSSEDTPRVETIAEMINQAITQARQLARGLYPVRLEVDGLTSALEEMAGSVKLLTQVNCHFASSGEAIIRDPVAGSNLFRIAQEAVANAIKHSRCKNVRISLDAIEDEITLTIKDDGIGLHPPEHNTSGMGLHIMKYRAQMIGATLIWQTQASGGTTVMCSFSNKNEIESQPCQSHQHQIRQK